MNQYLTNSIIKHKNEYINSLFYIEKGIILEEKTNKIFNDHKYLFLDYIFSDKITTSNYIAKTKVVGKWIPFSLIDSAFIKILSDELNKTKKHNEILLIKDPLKKISRYLFYEYEKNLLFSFYIPSLKELAFFLNISLKDVSISINYLINVGIISKHNKLINILKIKNLEEKAFLLDI